MLTLIRRVATVLLCLAGLLWLFQAALTRDSRPKTLLTFRVASTAPDGRKDEWQLAVNQYWQSHVGFSPLSVADAATKVLTSRGPLAVTAVDEPNRVTLWTATRDAGGKVLLDGRPSSMEAVAVRMAETARPPPDFRPTRAVTILDVLEANIPTPTRSKVSFPKFSYKQAFPEANNEPEIVITKFDESPMFKDLSSIPAEWRGAYPDRLPPVEERLPRNPAVVVGPDGLGYYGGTWRRCAGSAWEFYRKVCYESFLRHDPSGRLQPGLAYKWEVSPDNRVCTLHLRKGQKWSDGHPYTSQDVLWVCNAVIGSAYWSTDIPDWMGPTNGSALLYEEDVKDWPLLARRIVEEAAAPPSIGGKIKALAPASLWGRLRAVAGGDANDPDAIPLITSELNDLFRDANFYDAAAFRNVDANLELRELERVGASRLDADQLNLMILMLERGDLLRLRAGGEPNVLQPTQINRLNLLLFRTAYHDLVDPPRVNRVRVEAVPDETGDTSHIVRFIFPKPNSIFLEQTTTFMFYRFFSGSRHGAAPLHPQGCDVLAATDFLDWNGLFQRVLREADAPGPSPGKQLWLNLEEAARNKIRAAPPTADSPEAYREEVIAAINTALAKRTFYEPGAWKGLSVGAMKDRLREGKGLAEVFRSTDAIAEYQGLLVLEDLLRRYDGNGASSLTGADCLRLNVALFRAAYSEDPKHPLVARTRIEGLNEAAINHPRKYASWAARLSDRGNYHPLYNPHPPVLFAWRIISEKDAPQIVAVRNPYYYRVDAAGRQLPYLDAVSMTIAAQKEIRVLKLTSGNIDCQSREITFDEFTVLKQNEKKGDYEVRLWANDYCGEVTFFPLQSHKDPAYARLHEDANFRHALSLALNRQEIIDVVFMGVGRPSQFAVPEGSPYFNPRMAGTSVEYDPNRANRILDSLGLRKRGTDGMRLLPDGRSFIMDVNYVSGIVPIAAAQLACHYWQNVGINAQLKLRTGSMMYRLEEMGLSDIRVHMEGGNYFGPLDPGAYYPSHQAESVQWYQWAAYLRSGGRLGWPAPERIKELERMWVRMVTAPNEEAKMKAWTAITDRFCAGLPILAVMTSPGKIVYVRNNFKNVPKIAMAGWIAHEPGNCCPESFFFDPNYKKDRS